MSKVDRDLGGKGGLGFVEEHHGEDGKEKRGGVKRRSSEQARRLEDKI